MAMFRYLCPSCGKSFEELVKDPKEEVRCPACGTPAERVWCGKVYSATGKPPRHCSGKCSECSGCH